MWYLEFNVKKIMKKTFIKYEPPYGGQAYKVKGIIEGLRKLEEFNNKFCVRTKIKGNLIIYEGQNGNEYNYLSKKLLDLAFDKFGIVEKLATIQSISNENDKEYTYTWKFEEENIMEYINFMESIMPLPKYYIEPVSITLSYNFEWKEENGTILNYEKEAFINSYFEKNHIILHLSKNNSIILDLIFPFENESSEFVNYCKKIEESLPVKLDMKKMRYYIPNKQQSNYILRKLEIK
jgi:hypothetical protein